MAYLFNVIIFSITINFILDELIKNPVKIIDESEIDDFIISLDNTKFEIDSLPTLNIKKDDYEIKYKDKSYYLPQNILLCKNEFSLYFLFANFNYYDKKPLMESNNIIESLNIKRHCLQMLNIRDL